VRQTHGLGEGEPDARGGRGRGGQRQTHDERRIKFLSLLRTFKE
jgi:hypothetical protein